MLIRAFVWPALCDCPAHDNVEIQPVDVSFFFILADPPGRSFVWPEERGKQHIRYILRFSC